MTERQHDNIDSMFHLYYSYHNRSDPDEVMDNMLEYTTRFKDNEKLYEIVVQHCTSKGFFDAVSFTESLNNFMLTVLNYDNNLDLSIDDYMEIGDDYNYVVNSYYDLNIYDRKYLEKENSDFPVLTAIERAFNVYTDGNYAIDGIYIKFRNALILVLYFNLSKLLGYQFDINNYNLDDIYNAALNFYKSINDYDMHNGINEYLALNRINELADYESESLTMWKAAYHFMDNYFKDKIGCKRKRDIR